LPDFVQTVPISFPEIIRLKGEGFHYIKVWIVKIVLKQ
jgi:hypothetical protein